jgi:hypothetical protein
LCENEAAPDPPIRAQPISQEGSPDATSARHAAEGDLWSGDSAGTASHRRARSLKDWRFRSGRLRRHDRDFPGDRIRLHQVLRLGKFLQWHDFAYNRLDLAALDETHRLDQLAFVAEMGAE